MIRRLAGKLFILARAMAHPVAFGAVGAVYDAQGRVLLVRQSYAPGWRLPGGGIDRRETPEAGALRELAEEVGLTGGTATFVALYTRPMGPATNIIALFKVTGGAIAFRPSLEIREIVFADPAAPPAGCTDATLRRLAELSGAAPVSPWW
jgi:8-oxo-dGTP pyrophosphatase MutT (NUDIX family)